jgi:hypothetical protein
LGHEEDGDDPRPTNEAEELELEAIIKEEVENNMHEKYGKRRQQKVWRRT